MDMMMYLAEDWVRARNALSQQLEMLQSDPRYPQAGLSESVRARIAIHLKNAISDYDALINEYTDVERP